MTAQPRKHRHPEPGPADSPRRTAGPPLDEAARRTGLYRGLLYEQMRLGNLAYIKLGRRCQTIRHHLQHFLGIAS